MSFDQNVEDIRGYEYFGTRQGCDLIILSVDCVHYMHVPASTFGSVQSLSQIQFFVTPWTAAGQASLSITNSWSLLKLVHRVSDAIQPSHPLSLPSPPAFNHSQHQGLFQGVFHIRWPKYRSFSFSISPSNEYSELISFRMDWLYLLAVQGTLKSLL